MDEKTQRLTFTNTNTTSQLIDSLADCDWLAAPLANYTLIYQPQKKKTTTVIPTYLLSCPYGLCANFHMIIASLP
jgi:hypothetical protein